MIKAAPLGKRFLWMCIGISLVLCSQPPSALAQQRVRPETIVGRDTCKKCHSTEFDAWSASAHNKNAWALLSHPKAADFAKKMQIADVERSVCVACHGTVQKKNNKFVVQQGNSCESCHGGAGAGWLAAHADYGSGIDKPMTQLLAERSGEAADHKLARKAACAEAGMNRSEDALQIASNCLQCHIVPNEKLIAAGHPSSTKFEFVEWAQGEVRHNFLLDPKKNSEVPSLWLAQGESRDVEGRKKLMFVAGQLADLEISLRERAKVTSAKRGTLGDILNDRILDAADEIEDLEMDDLKPVLDVLEAAKIDKKSLKEVTANDKTTMAAAADKVAQAATAFIAKHKDGDQLPKIKLPKKAKGDPFGG